MTQFYDRARVYAARKADAATSADSGAPNIANAEDRWPQNRRFCKDRPRGHLTGNLAARRHVEVLGQSTYNRTRNDALQSAAADRAAVGYGS